MKTMSFIKFYPFGILKSIGFPAKIDFYVYIDIV